MAKYRYMLQLQDDSKERADTICVLATSMITGCRTLPSGV
jgi:hypothetical protein